MPHSKRKPKKAYILLALSLVAAGILGFAIYRLSSHTTGREQPQEPETITYSTDKPDETKPGDDYAWRGKPDGPKKIIIPSVGIDNFLQNVGVDQNREVAVPNNVHLAGWFADSVKPGSKGLSIIDGHINGRIQAGAVFRTLPEVQKGAEISVEFGDGSTKHFEVFDTTEILTDKAPGVLFSQDPTVTSQLNLITCVGNFDQAAHKYDKRLIVSAKLLE